jgi:cyclic beta-1,2-glucan synthetase
LHRGFPRIYALAKQLVSDTGMRLDREIIVAVAEAYQSVHTLTTAELWAIPQMLRVALSNLIHGDAVLNRFHSDVRVRAFEPLLHESVPALSVRYLSTHQQDAADGVGEIAPAVSSFNSAHTLTPKTQMLGNGRYSLMVTNSGGFFCYIHEPDTGSVWSNTYHPTCGEVGTYGANFALDRAVINHLDNGIEVKTEVAVSPEDDVEVRRITLINRSLRGRRLVLTSYTELSLAPHRADLQHPAFNKLFIQTEAIPEGRAVTGLTRARSRRIQVGGSRADGQI